MEMTETATKVWPLPSASRAFISVDRRGFQTYMKDAPGSVNEC